MLCRLFKNCIWCSRIFCKIFKNDKPVIQANKLPWFGIGVEAKDGSFVDRTSQINSKIKIGDFVDIAYLESKTGILNANWVILDAETIKMRKFPVGGFVIV